MIAHDLNDVNCHVFYREYRSNIWLKSSAIYAIDVKEALDLDLSKLWGLLNEIVIFKLLFPTHVFLLYQCLTNEANLLKLAHQVVLQ